MTNFGPDYLKAYIKQLIKQGLPENEARELALEDLQWESKVNANPD